MHHRTENGTGYKQEGFLQGSPGTTNENTVQTRWTFQGVCEAPHNTVYNSRTFPKVCETPQNGAEICEALQRRTEHKQERFF